ncbi:hypothetical protein [Mycoplasma sp. 392]
MEFIEKIDKEMEANREWIKELEEKNEKLNWLRDFIKENPDLANEENYETLKNYFIYDPFSAKNPASAYFYGLSDNEKLPLTTYNKLEAKMKNECKKQLENENFDIEVINKYISSLKRTKYPERNPYYYLISDNEYQLLGTKNILKFKWDYFYKHSEEMIERLGLVVNEEVEDRSNTLTMNM